MRVLLKDGGTLDVDGQLAGTPSQTVDAIAVIVSEKGCQALLKDAAAVQAFDNSLKRPD